MKNPHEATYFYPFFPSVQKKKKDFPPKKSWSCNDKKSKEELDFIKLTLVITFTSFFLATEHLPKWNMWGSSYINFFIIICREDSSKKCSWLKWRVRTARDSMKSPVKWFTSHWITFEASIRRKGIKTSHGKYKNINTLAPHFFYDCSHIWIYILLLLFSSFHVDSSLRLVGRYNKNDIVYCTLLVFFLSHVIIS